MNNYSSSVSTRELRMIFLGGIVFVVILMFFYSSLRSAEPQNQVLPSADKPDFRRYADYPDLALKHVDELIEQTHGDYAKLPEEEKDWIATMTKGHGPEFFKARTKIHNEEKQAKGKQTTDKPAKSAEKIKPGS